MDWRRSRALPLRESVESARPPMETSPLVASSRLPAIVNSVLLPEPLAPMTATREPDSTDRSMCCRASTSVAPSP